MLRIDPKWADPGRSGIAQFRGFYIVFTVLSSTVDHADILILDTDMEDRFQIGTDETFSWSSQFWQVAKEIG